MEEQNNQNKKKIVIVDDDNFLVDMYITKFKKEGYDAMAFTNSEDALNALKEGIPDLGAILLDLIMPKMDGWALLEELNKLENLKGVKKIILSNQGQPGDIEKAKKTGYDDYIIKAMNTPSEVVKLVAKHFE